MNKKQRQAFTTAVQNQLGGTPLTEDHEWSWMYDYRMDTPFGEYVYSIDAEDSIPSVCGRFTDEEKRSPLKGLHRRMNPTNGKFNFHFFESDGTPEELAEKIWRGIQKGV